MDNITGCAAALYSYRKTEFEELVEQDAPSL